MGSFLFLRMFTFWCQFDRLQFAKTYLDGKWSFLLVTQIEIFQVRIVCSIISRVVQGYSRDAWFGLFYFRDLKVLRGKKESSGRFIETKNFRCGLCSITVTSSKAQFRRRTFHEPNLITWIKYMKSSASESVKNGYFIWNGSAVLSAWLSREFRLWNGFDSDAEPFMSRT